MTVFALGFRHLLMRPPANASSGDRLSRGRNNRRKTMSLNRVRITRVATLIAALVSLSGWAQTAPPVVVRIDVENIVAYNEDVSDVSKLAADPAATTAAVRRTFEKTIVLGDVVAVNGAAVKGTLILNPRSLSLGPSATPGQAIGDATRANTCGGSFEILWPDGTQIGTIMVADMGGGPAPPGSPSAAASGNFAVIGGSGAFMGVRGHGGAMAGGVPSRQASMTEDPVKRRINGGGTGSWIFQLIPEHRPTVISLQGGPAIVHADNSQQVTAANPARPGETLTLYATGLGPVRASVDPGQPFPSSPLALVNSPVDVKVNGASASVSYAGGYPGTLDAYQVNFTLPTSLAPGMATLQVVAAWIPGAAITLPVQ
jgi:hypothetical protein